MRTDHGSDGADTGRGPPAGGGGDSAPYRAGGAALESGGRERADSGLAACAGTRDANIDGADAGLALAASAQQPDPKAGQKPEPAPKTVPGDVLPKTHMPGKLVIHRGDDVLGKEVVNPQGENLGEIKDLVIQPNGATDAINVGFALDTAGVLDLTDAELGRIADGFASITIGRANGQHAIRVQSATFHDPVTLRTPLGRYLYRHVRPAAFFGYRRVRVFGDQEALLAEPAKALLDLIYLTPRGETTEYLESLRLQDLDAIRARKFDVLWPTHGPPIRNVDAFIAAYNIEAKPFVWTKSQVHQKRLKPCFADQ